MSIIKYYNNIFLYYSHTTFYVIDTFILLSFYTFALFPYSIIRHGPSMIQEQPRIH